MIEKSHLHVKTDLADLPQVLSWFNRLNPGFVPRDIWIQCQTVLVEGFTNAVCHAHKTHPPETPIYIEVSILDDRLEIHIWDYGAAFDLNQSLKQMPEKLDSTASGGRGIRLIERIADRFSYTHIDRQNCLLIMKNYSKTHS